MSGLSVMARGGYATVYRATQISVGREVAIKCGRPPRWESDRSPSLVGLVELFDRPIPDIPGIPRRLTEILRYGMANDPKVRPTAVQLRNLLAGLQLHPGDPERSSAVYRSSG